MSQLDRDVRACVEFFLADPWAMFRALRIHRRGMHDRCVERCGPWPCLAYSTAAFAEPIHHARAIDVVNPDNEDAAFSYAIQANAVETTTPMRAVARPASAKHAKATR